MDAALAEARELASRLGKVDPNEDTFYYRRWKEIDNKRTQRERDAILAQYVKKTLERGAAAHDTHVTLSNFCNVTERWLIPQIRAARLETGALVRESCLLVALSVADPRGALFSDINDERVREQEYDSVLLAARHAGVSRLSEFVVPMAERLHKEIPKLCEKHSPPQMPTGCSPEQVAKLAVRYAIRALIQAEIDDVPTFFTDVEFETKTILDFIRLGGTPPAESSETSYDVRVADPNADYDGFKFGGNSGSNLGEE